MENIDQHLAQDHPPPSSRIKGTFRALKHRNYRLFFFGQLVSLIGTWLQNTALGWLVYSLTKDARALGIISFVGSIPILFFSVLAGTMADEYPKRKLLLVTQSGMALLALALSVLIWTEMISIWSIGVITLLFGVATAFDLPTRQAFVVELVSFEDVPNAIALNSTIFNGARLIGPALGALIIATLSIALCFFFNGVSFLAVIISLFMMRMGTERRTPSKEASRIKAMAVGVRYLYSVPQLRALMFLVVAMTLFGWSYSVNLPVVADQLLHGGASTYGALLTANGAGALLAALTQASSRGKTEPRKVALWGVLVFVVSLITIAFLHAKILVLLALVGTGWGIITFFITANTTLQRQVPDELRGRVMGIYSLAFAGLFPFGSLLAGFLAHQFGVSIAFLINGILLALVTSSVFFSIRNLPTLEVVAMEEYNRASEQAANAAEQIARG